MVPSHREAFGLVAQEAMACEIAYYVRTQYAQDTIIHELEELYESSIRQ